MSNNYLILGVILLCISCYGQKKYNAVSFESALGFSMPIGNNKNIIAKDYIFSSHLNLGIRYNFTKNLGLKFQIQQNKFRNISNKKLRNYYRSISLETVYNITKKLNLLSYNFNVLLRSGIGYTRSYPETINNYLNGEPFTFNLKPNIKNKYERIGFVVLGITPMYSYSNKIAFKIDINYNYNLQQQYGYNGELLFRNFKKIKSSFTTFAIGVHYYFGKKRDHADWYYNYK